MDPKKVTVAFGDNNLHIYRRERSSVWQTSVCLGGENHRASTKHKNLALAAEAAELFFLKHRLIQLLRPTGQTIQQFLGIELAASATLGAAPALSDDKRRKVVHSGARFAEAAELFIKEYPILTAGERSERYVKSHERRLRVNLLPFFGDMYLSEVTEAAITDYRQHRTANPLRAGRKHNPGEKRPRLSVQENEPVKPLGRAALHQDMVTLRLVLKTAKRHGMITHLPDMSEPYKKSKKIKPRPWFSPEEYQQLYEATREFAKNPDSERWKGQPEDLHDMILFAGNTGLRPDELARLQFRDVTIDDQDMGKGVEILHIRVAQGKRGFGNCKSMPGAVEPFRRVVRRRAPKPDDLVFPDRHRHLFNKILEETGLKHTRDGQARSLYSLRHTYICMRLIEGADYYAVAKNCRTGPDMIRDHYASHIKDLIDVSQLNVQRPASSRRKAKKAKKASQPRDPNP